LPALHIAGHDVNLNPQPGADTTKASRPAAHHGVIDNALQRLSAPAAALSPRGLPRRN
jgi:hypothetical protein